MALGTPCVGTAVTGIPELLNPGEAGLVVPEHDPAALAAALERFLTDPALRERVASQARRRMETDFDIRRTAARLRTIFHEASTAAVELAEAG